MAIELTIPFVEPVPLTRPLTAETESMGRFSPDSREKASDIGHAAGGVDFTAEKGGAGQHFGVYRG
jgi:hypothetical protein